MPMHVVVSGRVQGVGFRWFVLEAALELDLAGWVRNRPDGRVEVAAEGGLEQLARFRALLRAGPPHARVLAVEDVMAETVGLRRPFEIAR